MHGEINKLTNTHYLLWNVALFLKHWKFCFFGDFEYLVWLQSTFQALSIGTTYMVLKGIYLE